MSSDSKRISISRKFLEGKIPNLDLCILSSGRGRNRRDLFGNHSRICWGSLPIYRNMKKKGNWSPTKVLKNLEMIGNLKWEEEEEKKYLTPIEFSLKTLRMKSLNKWSNPNKRYFLEMENMNVRLYKSMKMILYPMKDKNLKLSLNNTKKITSQLTREILKVLWKKKIPD